MDACMCAQLFSHVQLCARLFCPRDSPGKDTGVGCHFLRPGTEPMSSVSLASAGRFFTTVPPVKSARISANLKKQGKGFPETWEQRHGVRISFTQGEGGLAVPVWIQEEEFLICKHSLKEASICPRIFLLPGDVSPMGTRAVVSKNSASQN